MVDLSYEVFHRDIEALVNFYVEALDFHRPQLDPTADYVVVRRDNVGVGCCRHHHADSIPRRPPEAARSRCGSMTSRPTTTVFLPPVGPSLTRCRTACGG